MQEKGVADLPLIEDRSFVLLSHPLVEGVEPSDFAFRISEGHAAIGPRPDGALPILGVSTWIVRDWSDRSSRRIVWRGSGVILRPKHGRLRQPRNTNIQRRIE